MKPHLAAGTLALTLAATPCLADWPWEASDDTRADYCRGFIVSGLGEFPIEALSRTNLWLGWNTLTREGIQHDSRDEYLQGKQEFANLLAAGNLDNLLGIADGECALGRN